MDRMDRIGKLHMVQGEVDGRCSVTADTAFHKPSVPWLMSATSVDFFLPKHTMTSPTSAALLDKERAVFNWHHSLLLRPYAVSWFPSSVMSLKGS